MTLPPQRIGDKGQRFEIRFRKEVDEPQTHRVLGWATNWRGAREMRDAWWDAPDVDEVWIVDRETGRKL
jgi:hypothetical protein